MASITDENYLVYNQGKNPLVNFNFMLRVEALFDLPCKSVHAFSRELEYDYIQEGGLNDYVHMRRKPISKPFTLEIDRYVGVDYIDCLPLGADLVLPVMLFVSRTAANVVIPFLVARTYVFTGCTVMKKEYGELSGDKSGLLVETTTLGYREMLCVDIPWSELGNNIKTTNRSNATAAITAPDALPALQQRSQGLCDSIKNAKDDAQKALADANAKSSLIPDAIAKEKVKQADLQKKVSQLEGSLPGLKSVSQAAAKTAADKKSALDEKRKKLDEAQKTFGTTSQDDRRAQSAQKEAKNAFDASAWKADALEKEASSASAALKEADKDLNVSNETLAEKKKASDDARDKAAKAKEEADKAKDALAKAEAEAEKTKQALSAAETALSTAKSDFNSAKSDADRAKASADTARSAYTKAGDDLSASKRDSAKTKEILGALDIASKTSQQRLDAVKNLPDTISGKVTSCVTENDAVQKASSLSDAQKHFPAVQSAANDAQSALRSVKAVQSYFVNCLSNL